MIARCVPSVDKMGSLPLRWGDEFHTRYISSIVQIYIKSKGIPFGKSEK